MSVDRVDNADENVDSDETSTVRLVCGQPTGLSTQFEEINTDFRVFGLPHAVKQAENFSVREFVKKIQSHPHREALQADLQQNNGYNPFSEESKKITEDTGNVELFELCKTIPKVQCKECLLNWNQGIGYCTCGHFLRENQSSRGVLRWTLDLLSIRNYVIKKERPHGHRYGKTKEQREYSIAHNLRKRCINRGFEGIHDRFQKDPTLRESEVEIDRTDDELCGVQDRVNIATLTRAFCWHTRRRFEFTHRGFQRATPLTPPHHTHTPTHTTHAENLSVRELVKKIQSHLHRRPSSPRTFGQHGGAPQAGHQV